MKTTNLGVFGVEGLDHHAEYSRMSEEVVNLHKPITASPRLCSMCCLHTLTPTASMYAIVRTWPTCAFGAKATVMGRASYYTSGNSPLARATLYLTDTEDFGRFLRRRVAYHHSIADLCREIKTARTRKRLRTSSRTKILHQAISSAQDSLPSVHRGFTSPYY